jgi:hypothetical protein
MSDEPWKPLVFFVARSEVGNRSAAQLVAVIAGLQLKSHRYQARDLTGDEKNETFCNVALWDFSCAMGVEIPHWVDAAGNPAPVGKGRELSANATCDWLESCGLAHGWRRVDRVTANGLAVQGLPCCVSWKNPAGPGHLAIIRPPENGRTMIAQAGGMSFEKGTLEQGFGKLAVKFWAAVA